MQSIEERKAHYEVIIRTCYTANFMYLLLHLIYLILFLIDGIYTMVYINIASIVLYCLCFFLLQKRKYYPYALVCGNEFLVYMSVATVLVGFNTGFVLNIIGLCIVTFFTSYFSKEGNRIAKSIIWCSLSFVICIVLYINSCINNPVYNISRWLYITLLGLHLLCVFLFISAYLTTFLAYAIKLENKITIESRTDKLTQIHNRYDLYNYFNTLDNKLDYALAMFDIDDFKVINDNYGHLCGDYILKELAQFVTKAVPNSFVSRYGGEEFIIISKMNGDIKNSFNELDEMRKKIEEHVFKFNDNEIKLTITIGLAKYESDIIIEDWIGIADARLYEGKNRGKNITVME